MKGNRPILAAPLPRQLDRWEDTDPDTWPAEWADVPIPFVLTGKGTNSTYTPRVRSRRNVLGLIAGAASGLILSRGRAGAAATSGRPLRLSQSTPRPLALAYSSLLDARWTRLHAEVDPRRHEPFGSPASEAQERRLAEAVNQEAAAEQSLVELVAESAGVDPTPRTAEALMDIALYRPLAVLVENGWVYQAVAVLGGSKVVVRPVVFKLGASA